MNPLKYIILMDFEIKFEVKTNVTDLYNNSTQIITN